MVKALFHRLASWLARPRVRVVLVVVVVLGVVGYFVGPRLWASYHLRAGTRELERHHPRAAYTHLERVLRIWPESVEAHRLAARAARRDGDLDTAHRHLVECQRLEKRPSEETLLEWAMFRATCGNLAEVQTFLHEKIQAGDPRSGLIYEALIEGYLRVYQIYAALGGLREWLDKEPNHPVALSLRGRTFQRVHAYPKAVEDFRRVIEIDAERDDDRYRLADCLLEVGQPVEAGRHLEMLRVRRPEDDQVLIRLAFAWHQTGRSGESLGVLEALLARAPDNVLALSAHAQIDFQLGRIAAAESYARGALALDSYDRQAHFTLYQALAQQPGREEEAKLQQAQVRQLEVRLNRLIEVTNRLMPQRPKDPELHCELGTLLRGLGRKELALVWYESALKLDPNHPATHRALSEHYTEVGDPQKAAQHHLQAEAKIPTTVSGP